MNCIKQKANNFLPCINFVSSILRSELHVSAVCNWKWKRSPNKAHELPEPIKTSLGRLVSRGMVPKDPPTGYTAKPIKVVKTGGRGVTGRIEIRRIGGGKPVVWHMADLVRISSHEADPKIEVIKDIISEQTRSAYLALVVGGEHKRWILATANMKVGDIIQSTREIPAVPISGQPGDSHPVGALAIGTQVCAVERFPYGGSKVANSAGNSAIIKKKVGDKVYLQMPSKREMVVDENCLCVVGRISNISKNKIVLGKAGASRWLGIRPKSGLWMRKTGLHGRKIKPLKKPRHYEEPKEEEAEYKTFTVDPFLFNRKRRGLSYF